MFSEVLKFTPTVDRARLNGMLRDLSRRFTDVAKKFGNGLKNAMRLAPMFAVTGAILNKLLNPLKNAEEIIDRVLAKGDDSVTNADEFGSDAGKLLRLEALGRAKGLDAETLRQLLGKFQEALATEQIAAQKEALLPPEERAKVQPGILRQFVGETDTAEAFFKFVQSLQQADKATQVVVQSQVFGERVRGKASEFFNAKDFADVLARLPSAEKLGAAAKRAGGFADQKDLNTAVRESEDFVRKAELVNGSMVADIDRSERQKLRSEDETLKRFDSLKSTSIAVQELTHKFDKMTTSLLSDIMPQVVKSVNALTEAMATISPYLIEFKEFVGEKIVQTMEVIDKIGFKIENLWNEFKSSRVYKFFGK